MYAPRPYRRRTPWLLVLGLAILFAMLGILLFVLFAGGFGALSGHPFFGLWGGFLLVFLLLWIGFFVVRIAFWGQRFRYRGAGGGGYAPPDPAVMVARRRYARGEITREQFDQIMSDLGRRPPLP